MSVLTGIPHLLSEFGVSLAETISGLPVEPPDFEDLDKRIPYRLVGEILQRCVERTACPHFGLLLGARFDHRVLGAPGQYMANAPDLGTALSGFVALQQSNSGGAAAYLHRSGDHWLIGYGIYEPKVAAQDQIYPLVMALALNFVRALTEGAVRPTEVLLSVRQPSDLGPHKSVFGAPIRFNQAESGVVLPRAALKAPIPGARPTELKRLLNMGEAVLRGNDQIWTSRVRHAIRPLLLRGESTTESMAAFLDLHIRTVTRRLEGEGTTFQTLLDEVRYAMSRELLTVTQLPIGDIADALAYSTHSNFGEAFRRWSGVTPTEWRDRARRSA